MEGAVLRPINTMLKCSLFALVCVPAMAQWSFMASATSDYVWRGFSLSDEQPAVQGGAEYFHQLGFYGGAWASTVDIDNDAKLEGLGYLGYVRPVWKFDLEVGLTTYAFDGDEDRDFTEVYTGMIYRALTLRGYYDVDRENLYGEIELDFDLGSKWFMHLHGGYTDNDSGFSYEDYRVAFGRTIWWEIDVEAAYVDTDIDDLDVADARGVLTITKTW